MQRPERRFSATTAPWICVYSSIDEVGGREYLVVDAAGGGFGGGRGGNTAPPAPHPAYVVYALWFECLVNSVHRCLGGELS